MYAAKALARSPVRITLVDRRNFHLFQPLLYQVATGGLSPSDIASPLRWILRKQRNVRVLLGEVHDVDVVNRRVFLEENKGRILYDSLIIATGSTHDYFGHPEWAKFAPGLKTIEDATEIRRRVLLAFEAAEREQDPVERQAWLTFIVVGAGPTGVELAGALGEIAHDTLRKDFRSIRPQESRILLLDAAPRVLPPYPPDLSEKAERQLINLGVRTRVNLMVTNVDREGVTVRPMGNGHEEHIRAKTVLWAAGVAASSLGKKLAEATGAQTDRAGRIFVSSDLTIPNHPEIFVVGDLAHVEEDGKMVPGVAPAAMQMGRYAAKVITARVKNEPPPGPFHYHDKGSLSTVGRSAAVAYFSDRVKFSGWLAWVIWLFVHLMYLVGFENRLVVLIQWAFNYFTYNRRARLITGGPPELPPIARPGAREPGAAQPEPEPVASR